MSLGLGVRVARRHRENERRAQPERPCSGSEAGAYLRLIDSCITQLKAQGPSRTCYESKEEAEKHPRKAHREDERRAQPERPCVHP